MKTFKHYIIENADDVVSFDFDSTISMPEWDVEEGDYVRDNDGMEVATLNEEIAQKIKEYKENGYTVYLITSRYDRWRDETEQFLKDHNLFQYFDDVIFTNGAWKADTCKRKGVKIHYDDDIEELRRLKYKGIKGIRVGEL
jgi:acid phosphatase class B